MNKRQWFIIAIVILIVLALVFKLRSMQPVAASTGGEAILGHEATAAATSPKSPLASPASQAARVVSVNGTTQPLTVDMPTIKPSAPTSTPPAAAGNAAPSEAARKAMIQIGHAYIDFVNQGGGRILSANSGDTVHRVALELAQMTNLTDPKVYFVPGDPQAPNTLPASVNDPAFANATLSIEFAANTPDENSSTTPIAWTRGLRDDGTWAPDSPFGGQGGYILFRDGHVLWTDKLSFEPGGILFVKPGASTPTANIHEAIAPGVVILRAEPAK